MSLDFPLSKLQDHTFLSQNTLPPRSTIERHSTLDKAKSRANLSSLVYSDHHFLSLDGTWSFNYSKNPSKLSSDFFNTTPDASWTTISVPSYDNTKLDFVFIFCVFWFFLGTGKGKGMEHHVIRIFK